jgi:ComF family protein
MKLLHRISALLFPPKCVLCQKLLEKQETDLCHSCRTEISDFEKSKRSIPFLESWTALWYYSGSVRKSLLRFKFGNRRSYAQVYGRLLAMKLLREYPDGFDILTWTPISRLRRLRRGYDQVELLAQAVGNELGIEPIPTLVKVRNNPPQSTIQGFAQRKANVLGAYRPVDPDRFRGKRVLLLDDIITSGATVSEAARVLLTAGANEVVCAAVAAASHEQKKSQ